MKSLFVLLSALALLLLSSTACNRSPKSSALLGQQLLAAVEKQNISLVQKLLRDGANIESKDSVDDTPLIIAAENADVPMTKLLLQNNANVEAQGNGGETALVNAARGHVDVVKTLLEKVSDVHDQEHALLAASESGPVGVIYISSDSHLNKPDPHQQIKEMAEVAIVRLLLDRNIGIETRDGEGDTPLILAASHGQIEIVQLLLDRGVQVDARDNYGNTALIAAACACAQATMRPTYDILGLLLDKGAKINAQSKDGSTALMNAATGFEIENAELLIKRGAKLRIKDKNGKTALQLAVESKKTKAAQLLRAVLAAN